MATANDEATFSRMFRNAVQFALGSKFSEIEELIRVQEESLYQLLKRRDVFSVLPTGYGKSLIFQLVPGVCSYLRRQGLNYPQHAVLIVICPLNALIASHIRELEHHGIKACSLLDPSINEEDLLAAKYSIIFTSPESIVQNEKWRSMLKSSVYQEHLFGIVTDEAHVVPKW